MLWIQKDLSAPCDLTAVGCSQLSSFFLTHTSETLKIYQRELRAIQKQKCELSTSQNSVSKCKKKGKYSKQPLKPNAKIFLQAFSTAVTHFSPLTVIISIGVGTKFDLYKCHSRQQRKHITVTNPWDRRGFILGC